MDRLWAALVLAAVLCLQGAFARDKTNMPKAKEEEGQANNATATGQASSTPADGRSNPEFLLMVYNGSALPKVPGHIPPIVLDGETLDRLTNSTKPSENASAVSLDKDTLGKLVPKSNASATTQGMASISNSTNASHSANATTSLDEQTLPEMGNRTLASNASAETTTWIVTDSNVPDTSSAVNTTTSLDARALAQMGNVSNATDASPDGPVTQLNGSVAYASNAGNAPVNSPSASMDMPAKRANRSVASDALPQIGTSDGRLPWATQRNASAVDGGRNFKGSRVVHVDVEKVAQGYRFAPGSQPQPSSNRSNDPDVVAMKEIASVVLYGPEENAAIMTDVVILSVLPDAGNGTIQRHTQLHGTIQDNFRDEDLMRSIVEGDANQAPKLPEQGPCKDCPEPHSVICALCWPVDFCRPFASHVNIPCPAEQS